MNEQKLVVAAKFGGAMAFDALCELNREKLLRRMYRITRNREDAEDALQEAFLSAFVHLGSFDGRASFSTWLTRIAINAALMILRKKRSSREMPMEGYGEAGEDAPMWEIADAAANPEKDCAQREREGILREAIRDLRPAVREVVEIQQLQEFSLKETAGIMGISVSAAKARLFHGKAVLRRTLRRRTNRNGLGRRYVPRFGQRWRESGSML